MTRGPGPGDPRPQRPEPDEPDLARLLDDLGEAGARLRRVLSDASAASHTEELRREDLAVAAFRATRERTPESRTGSRSWLSRALTVKAAAAAGIIGVTGLAVAAVTTNVPILPPRDGAVTPAHDRSSRPGPTAAPTPRATGGPATGGATADTTPGSSAQAIADLCRAYLALPPGQARRALDRPPLLALAEQAGGAANVEAFCSTVPSAHPGRGPARTDQPGVGPDKTKAPKQTKSPEPKGPESKGPESKGPESRSSGGPARTPQAKASSGAGHANDWQANGRPARSADPPSPNRG
jgi:hypothetical protein